MRKCDWHAKRRHVSCNIIQYHIDHAPGVKVKCFPMEISGISILQTFAGLHGLPLSIKLLYRFDNRPNIVGPTLCMR